MFSACNCGVLYCILVCSKGDDALRCHLGLAIAVAPGTPRVRLPIGFSDAMVILGEQTPIRGLPTSETHWDTVFREYAKRRSFCLCVTHICAPRSTVGNEPGWDLRVLQERPRAAHHGGAGGPMAFSMAVSLVCRMKLLYGLVN